MKIFIGIPSYDPKLQSEVVHSLFKEQQIATHRGDSITLSIISGDAGIVGARNQLVTNFFDSGCEKLFFLDSDITWEAGDLLKLCHYPLDFVGGAYRYKTQEEKYPIRFLPESAKKDISNPGLMEVDGLPTGFLSISKNVFEKIILKNPNRLYEHFDSAAYAFFQMFFKDGCLVGEDYLFCRDWQSTGGKIYLDPDIKLTHWNIKYQPHVGHIGNWMKKENKNGLPEERLSQGL